MCHRTITKALIPLGRTGLNAGQPMTPHKQRTYFHIPNVSCGCLSGVNGRRSVEWMKWDARLSNARCVKVNSLSVACIKFPLFHPCLNWRPTLRPLLCEIGQRGGRGLRTVCVCVCVMCLGLDRQTSHMEINLLRVTYDRPFESTREARARQTTFCGMRRGRGVGIKGDPWPLWPLPNTGRRTRRVSVF